MALSAAKIETRALYTMQWGRATSEWRFGQAPDFLPANSQMMGPFTHVYVKHSLSSVIWLSNVL